MSYITTYTGKRFDPTNPDANLLDIKDIAHALSLVCRGNGHVKVFYSVGQHCIDCCKEAIARGYSKRVALACLIHDAGECYMSDVPRPLKENLTEYVKQEDKLLNMIYEHFLGSPITDEERALVKEIDDDMLYYDLTDLLGIEVEGEAPNISTERTYDFIPFAYIEKKYLELYGIVSCNG